MSKSAETSFWNRLKNIVDIKSNDGYTVIPGNQHTSMHIRYDDGSVSVVPLHHDHRELVHLR